LAGCGDSFFDWGEVVEGSAREPISSTEADADSVGFPQSSVYGTSFGNAHFGAVYKERNIGRIGVSISDKAFAVGRLVHYGLECPSCLGRV
jgi:hypothetical protein